MPENQFVVAIALEKPSVGQNIASSMLKRSHDGDEIKTRHEDVLKPQQKTGQDNGKELATSNEDQKKVGRTTGDIAPTTTEAPPEPSPQWQAFVEMLRREEEIVVSTPIDGGDELVELEIGDLLELDPSEYLHPKAGSVGAMFILYDWL